VVAGIVHYTAGGKQGHDDIEFLEDGEVILIRKTVDRKKETGGERPDAALPLVTSFPVRQTP
jgi:hypothetical protein